MLGDPELPHLFFVEGGALAVENALKCAFDWKSRRNEAAGRSPELGTKVLHLTRAFHGRSGYTLSLTNTDPVKTDRFPKFDWPRIEVPAIHSTATRRAEAAEARALAQAREAFERYPHDIACFIAEPIQGEGGDNHMRPEFLQAMQRLCHEYDALFILDEVQTGVGTHRHPLGLPAARPAPDIVAFAKKVQVGGIMAGRRVDLVPGQRVPGERPDQLHLGRRAGRHGALPADAGDHRAGRPDPARRHARRAAPRRPAQAPGRASPAQIAASRPRPDVRLRPAPAAARTGTRLLAQLRDEDGRARAAVRPRPRSGCARR